MIDALYVMGAIASILGAIYAWRQASNAKKYALRAERQVAGHRVTSDLSRLEEQWTWTYQVLAVFGPSARQADLRGKNPAEAARKVQDYIEAVKHNKASLQTITDLDNRCNRVTPLLDAFSSSRSADDLKKNGTNLLTELSELNAAICSILVIGREKVDLT